MSLSVIFLQNISIATQTNANTHARTQKNNKTYATYIKEMMQVLMKQCNTMHDNVVKLQKNMKICIKKVQYMDKHDLSSVQCWEQSFYVCVLFLCVYMA